MRKTSKPRLVGKELPVMQESLSRPDTAIYYFWTEDNAFLDTSDFVGKLVGRPREEVLARAYGIPSKSITSVFPGFNKDVNVIPHETMPFIRDENYQVTRYMAIDPAGSKNWFMLWVAIDAANAAGEGQGIFRTLADDVAVGLVRNFTRVYDILTRLGAAFGELAAAAGMEGVAAGLQGIRDSYLEFTEVAGKEGAAGLLGGLSEGFDRLDVSTRDYDAAAKALINTQIAVIFRLLSVFAGGTGSPDTINIA